jgi:hypothetical protein
MRKGESAHDQRFDEARGPRERDQVRLPALLRARQPKLPQERRGDLDEPERRREASAGRVRHDRRRGKAQAQVSWSLGCYLTANRVVCRCGTTPVAATLPPAQPKCAAETPGSVAHAARRASSRHPSPRHRSGAPPAPPERPRPHPPAPPISRRHFAVDLDPLSLLCRLAASVPPPFFNVVRYAGVLAPASKLRPLVVPPLPPQPPTHQNAASPCSDCSASDHTPSTHRSGYRPWRELLMRTFKIDVDKCDRCGDRLKLRALVLAVASIHRLLRRIGEPTEPPVLSAARGPPFFKSRALRLRFRHAGDQLSVPGV